MLFLLSYLLLEKWFVILQHNYKHLSSVPNEVKKIIDAIYMQK